MKRSCLMKSSKLVSACVALGIASSAISAWSATWTGQDGVTPVTNLSNGGEVTERTFLNLQNNETVSISGVISGSAGLTVNGPGTLTLSGKNTYNGAIYLSKGTANAKTTLKLVNNDFILPNVSSLNFGTNAVLDLATGNALGYVGGAGILNTINVKGNSLITTSVAGIHNNLGNIVVATNTHNNKIEATKGASGYCNYFLAGKITVGAGASLEIDVEKLITRRNDASLWGTVNGVENQKLSGVFEVGEGGTLTVGTSLADKTAMIYINDSGGNQAGQVRKIGTGTMTVNGNITATEMVADTLVSVEAGTLNVNGIQTVGKINVSGGTLNAKRISTGSGKTTVSGGNLTITDILEVGGSFLVENGTATLTRLDTWSSGTSTFTGGTTTATTLTGLGKVIVDGGSLTAKNDSSVGQLVVSKGSFTAEKKLTLTTNTQYASATGTLTVSGGTATINTLDNSGDVSVTGGTLKITGAITGAGAVAVDGGTLNLAGELAYNKDLNVTKGGTLNVSVANAMKNGTISLDNGQLLITAGNAFGYNNDGKGTMPNINMANGSTITSSANDHSNIGNITASGTGNIITAAESDTGSQNFGNLFFAGKVVVADNSDLTIDLHKATLRTGNGAIMENEKNVSGVFDVGENSTVTANIDTLRFQCTNGQASFEKTGVGDMFLNGTISKDAIIKVTEGTLNLNTTVNTTDQNLGAPTNAKPTITVTADGTLGTGVAKGEIGTLNLAESTVTLDGGRLEVDLSSASSDMYVFDTLVLKDDAQIELVWMEGEDYAEKYENIIVAEIVDENGDYIKNLLDYMTGSLLDKYNLQNVGNAWSLVLAGDGPVTPGSEVPEPSTVLMFLLGTGFLGYYYRKK